MQTAAGHTASRQRNIEAVLRKLSRKLLLGQRLTSFVEQRLNLALYDVNTGTLTLFEFRLKPTEHFELLGDAPRLTKKSGLCVFERGWVRGGVKSDASLFNQLLVATSAGHCRSSRVVG
jgi:hypothetical protein